MSPALFPLAAGPPVTIGRPRQLVPGPAAVEGIDIGASNNNLDLAWCGDDLLMVWRSAPTHFASADTRLHAVVSDDGGTTWHHEQSWSPGRDAREPRLVHWHDRTLLYWFTAGTSGTRFEPDRIWVSERRRAGHWSDPVAVSPPDCVVWRVRPIGDRLAMSIYRNAATLFTAHPRPLEVELWGSDDGLVWGPFDGDRPMIHWGGSETEFLPLPDGRIVGVVRKEGPQGGWGADVGVAAADMPARWRWREDPRKFDSPFLFADRGRPFLVTRRTTSFGGRYDLGVPRRPRSLRTRVDQIAYWLTPKRTALYTIDADTLVATWLADLPSAGDTAFAAAVPADPARPEGRWLVANYSSALEHTRWPWVRGQLAPTHIHMLELTIDP